MSGAIGMLERWDEERPQLMPISLRGFTINAYESSKVDAFLSKIKKELKQWQKFQDELEKNDIIQYTGDSEEPWIYGPAVRTSDVTGESQ